MGSLTILLTTLSVLLAICTHHSVDASSRCPPPSAIYQYSKQEQCHSDTQCPASKVCCVTPARNRACVQPAYGAAASGYHEKGTANGIYCGNMKCNPHEKCAQDSRGKPVCKRY